MNTIKHFKFCAIGLLCLLLSCELDSDFKPSPTIDPSPSTSPMACYSFNQTNTTCNSDCQIDFNAACSQNAESYDWNFGDPTSNENTGTGLQVSHVYSASGNYNVELTVTQDNQMHDTTLTVVINLEEDSDVPIACFNFFQDFITCSANCVVEFDASCSSNASSFNWEFGDTGSSSNNASGLMTTHSYSTHGTYFVNLSVTDNNGLTNETQMEIEIQENPIETYEVILSQTNGRSERVSEALLIDDVIYICGVTSDEQVILAKYPIDSGDDNDGTIIPYGNSANYSQCNMVLNSNNFIVSGFQSDNNGFLIKAGNPGLNSVLYQTIEPFRTINSLSVSKSNDYLAGGYYSDSGINPTFSRFSDSNFGEIYNQNLKDEVGFGIVHFVGSIGGSEELMVIGETIPGDNSGDELFLMKRKLGDGSAIGTTSYFYNALGFNVFDVEQGENGNYYILGRTANRFLVAVFDSDLQEIVMKNDIPESIRNIRSITPLSDGGAMLCGAIGDDLDAWNAYAIKLDAEMDEQWSTEIGQFDFSQSFSGCVEHPDGGYVFIGEKGPHINDTDIYVVKTDDQGKI